MASGPQGRRLTRATCAEEAGFVDLRLSLTAEVTRRAFWRTRDWDVFLDSSPNPLAPTLREGLEIALSPTEAQRLEAVLRPQVESGLGMTRWAHALLLGHKPGAGSERAGV